eukprot:SAG31_NODE_23255_length_507_cov_45.122549_1_plen_87_part_00
MATVLRYWSCHRPAAPGLAVGAPEAMDTGIKYQIQRPCPRTAIECFLILVVATGLREIVGNIAIPESVIVMNTVTPAGPGSTCFAD